MALKTVGSDKRDKEERLSPLRSESLLLIDEHEEEVHVDGRKERRKGVYLLPNLFTTGALFAGFYAIIAGMQSRFEVAAIAIVIAGMLDGLDGRVARLTNTQSKFGEQYDSMSDLVSFGVAPALVVFNWALVNHGKLGWSAAFIFVACAALRLARFNAMIDTADKKYFTGLASPAAAGLMASLVWFCTDIGWVGAGLPVEMSALVVLITALVGLLMIVNVRYFSFKGIDFRGRVPFVVMIAIVFVIALVMQDPPTVLLAVGVIYALSGPGMAIYKRVRHADAAE